MTFIQLNRWRTKKDNEKEILNLRNLKRVKNMMLTSLKVDQRKRKSGKLGN